MMCYEDVSWEGTYSYAPRTMHDCDDYDESICQDGLCSFPEIECTPEDVFCLNNIVLGCWSDGLPRLIRDCALGCVDGEADCM